MPTSILLSLAGKTILVDAGLGAARSICDQGVALTDLDAVFVTHLHSDHYIELGPLIHTAWTAGLTRPLPVYGPPGLKRYWNGFLTSMEDDTQLRIADEGRVDLATLVEIHTIDHGEVARFDDISVRAMRNWHPPIKDSFALRFDGPGKSVCLSGDTAFMDEMASFAKDADLLVHEAMLTEGVDAVVAKVTGDGERLRHHILRSHTAAEDVGRVAKAARVAKLALNHFVPDGLPGFEETDWKVAVRKTWAGPLVIGQDGMRIDL